MAGPAWGLLWRGVPSWRGGCAWPVGRQGAAPQRPPELAFIILGTLWFAWKWQSFVSSRCPEVESGEGLWRLMTGVWEPPAREWQVREMAESGGFGQKKKNHGNSAGKSRRKERACTEVENVTRKRVMHMRKMDVKWPNVGERGRKTVRKLKKKKNK